MFVPTNVSVERVREKEFFFVYSNHSPGVNFRNSATLAASHEKYGKERIERKENFFQTVRRMMFWVGF